MTTENLKNPSVIVQPNPVDLDLAIATIQQGLGSLAWLEKIFGRAKEVTRVMPDNSRKREPMVYQGGKEYYPVLPNDALKAYCFFRSSSRGFDEFLPFAYSQYSRSDLDLIVWANLKKVDAAKDYIFTEELLNEVIGVLGKVPDLEVIGVFDDRPEDIFSGYNINPTHRELLMYPYQAFRVALNLRFKVACA